MTILNIGLNNNPLTFEAVKEIFSNLYGAEVEYRVMTYNDTPEPTAIVRMTQVKPLSWVEDLCQKMNQECIAVKLEGIGYLVYDPNFSGNRYGFDQQFFAD